MPADAIGQITASGAGQLPVALEEFLDLGGVVGQSVDSDLPQVHVTEGKKLAKKISLQLLGTIGAQSRCGPPPPGCARIPPRTCS